MGGDPNTFAPATLADEQRRIGALRADPWRPGPAPVVGGVFLAFARGEQGPGGVGDRAWVGAVAVDGQHRVVAEAVVAHRAAAAYEAGLLAGREGAGLVAAVEALRIRPDVVLVDATGRDHPRRAGVAVHLGWVLDLPTVGVTHRPLLAAGPEPGPVAGDHTDLRIGDEVVGAWLRTRAGTRPLAVHAGWRTDPVTAVDVVMRSLDGTRTPGPLREARRLAREARSTAEARRQRR